MLYKDEIISAMDYLNQLLGEIDRYPDKSLFFQNPQIIEGWLHLVRTITELKFWSFPEKSEKWFRRLETYTANQLAMRELYNKYKDLYRNYYEQLKNLLDGYGGWLGGDCISEDGIEALLADKYENDLEDVEDLNLYIEDLNKISLKTRFSVYETLSEIQSVLLAVMNRGGKIVNDYNPSDDDFAKAIDDDLKEWTLIYGKGMFRKMKEELNKYYKANPTDHNTRELWGEMLRADEDALKMAKKQQLSKCKDDKQNHWGDYMKNQMDNNVVLMGTIYSSCFTEELIDLRNAESVQPFIDLLTYENLPVFYDIIVRRNLIQCEMFPELNAQHEKWLKGEEELKPEEVDDADLSIVRQSKLAEIIGILQKGKLKEPATAENIALLLNILFGKDKSLLEKGDEPLCEKMWALIESGTGERMVIVPANLAGFFSEENLLAGSPMEISNDLFGKDNNQVNNINKGNSARCSNAFKEVIPFIRKYINKIIRQA